MDKPIEQMNQEELMAEQNLQEKCLRDANDNLSLCEQYDIDLSRQIIALQLKKKDNAIVMSKASANVKNTNSLLRELKARYWQARNG